LKDNADGDMLQEEKVRNTGNAIDLIALLVQSGCVGCLKSNTHERLQLLTFSFQESSRNGRPFVESTDFDSWSITGLPLFHSLLDNCF
jgi:hypothetical protein